jgi:hypothetical protein
MDKASYFSTMVRTKLCWIIVKEVHFFCNSHDFRKIVWLVNGCTFCCFFPTLANPTFSNFDSNIYFTKSLRCSFNECFFIDVYLWLGLYCTWPFQELVVLWEFCSSSTWEEEFVWQMMYFICLNNFGKWNGT